jgi:molecular chaperone GrpE
MTKSGKSKKKEAPEPGEEQLQLRAERLQRELDEKNSTLEEYTVLIKQLQADFDNYRKRMDTEQKRMSQYAKEGMVEDMLPILDSFEKAVQHCSEEGIEGTGIIGIHKQLDSLMVKWGVTEIDASGCFNPNFHEALMVEEADEDNLVLEVFQKGYQHQGRVIRSTKVKVSKVSDKDECGQCNCDNNGCQQEEHNQDDQITR